MAMNEATKTYSLLVVENSTIGNTHVKSTVFSIELLLGTYLIFIKYL